jgi:hypothetical protein
MKTYIIMADVLNSSGKNAIDLSLGLKQLVQQAQLTFSTTILSPLTITLGDEFQGVIRSLEDGVKLMIWFEEQRILQQIPFKLRLVLHFGEIHTELNPKIAYGMLGPGLTEARKLLSDMKKDPKRFNISGLAEAKTELLIQDGFVIFQSFVDSWTNKEAQMAALFLKNDDYRWVAKQARINPTSAWRRRKSLQINAYIASKNILSMLSK